MHDNTAWALDRYGDIRQKSALFYFYYKNERLWNFHLIENKTEKTFQSKSAAAGISKEIGKVGQI